MLRFLSLSAALVAVLTYTPSALAECRGPALPPDNQMRSPEVRLTDGPNRTYEFAANNAATITVCEQELWKRTTYVRAVRAGDTVDWVPDMTVTADAGRPGGLVVSSAMLRAEGGASPAPRGLTGSLAPKDPSIASYAALYRPTTAAEAAAAPGNPCTQTSWGQRPDRQPWAVRTEGYRTRDASFPYSSFRSAAIAGLNAWRDTYNSCGLNDITNLVPSLLGSTTTSYHTVTDNTSVLDVGNINNTLCEPRPGFVVIGCTSTFPDAANRIHEFDIRFSDSPSTFSTTGASDRADFQSVSTHEMGHAIGLAHVDDNALTMYWKARDGDLGPRSLGKGDVLGMRALYP